MLEWADWAYDQVRLMAKTDREHQQLREEHEHRVKEFDAVPDRLSEADNTHREGK